MPDPIDLAAKREAHPAPWVAVLIDDDGGPVELLDARGGAIADHAWFSSELADLIVAAVNANAALLARCEEVRMQRDLLRHLCDSIMGPTVPYDEIEAYMEAHPGAHEYLDEADTLRADAPSEAKVEWVTQRHAEFLGDVLVGGIAVIADKDDAWRQSSRAFYRSQMLGTLEDLGIEVRADADTGEGE